MRPVVVISLVLLLGGCIPDAPNASTPTRSGPSTSSRRSLDPDQPKQMCQDTSMGGDARTVCY